MTADTLCAELNKYARRLAAMTDEQLTVELARVEALPGGECRHLVDREAEARQAQQHEQETRDWLALLAAMKPPHLWGCQR